MELYRADDEDLYTGKRSCWTPREEWAIAYTDNPGFGGPIVWVAEVDGNSSLDMTVVSVGAMWERVADLAIEIDEDNKDWANRLRDEWCSSDTACP